MALFVTDTHPLIWYAEGRHGKLSKYALRIFNDALNGQAVVYIPAMALLEIALLQKRGRIGLDQPFEHWASSLLALGGFDLVPLDLQVITEARCLTLSNDPFDTAIVATARVKDLPLITRDSAITDAGLVEIAW